MRNAGCAIAMQLGMAKAQQATAAAGQNNATAIDILLEPDATMIAHAQAANARLASNSIPLANRSDSRRNGRCDSNCQKKRDYRK
jgi:flagellar biosynthesis/type III secretory pathway protein FliH